MVSGLSSPRKIFVHRQLMQSETARTIGSYSKSSDCMKFFPISGPLIYAHCAVF